MVAYKASQVESVIDKPERFRAFLLYGPEPGSVSDRADLLSRKLTEKESGEIVRLDDAALAAEPDKLSIELCSRSLFGGTRVIRLKAGGRLDVELLAELIEGPMEATLIVEAGQLRPNAKLRQIFETSKTAAALPCYFDADRDLPALIAMELERHGLGLSRDAKAYLMDRLGADPAMARQELVKLALFAEGADRIELAQVEAVVGDISEAAMGALAEAAASGKAREALRQLDRLVAAGTGPQSALSGLARHFERLHRLAGQVEAGGSIKQALDAIRPPLHFSQRDVMAEALNRWSRPRAATALELLQWTTAQARLRPDLERQLVERAILTVAGSLKDAA